MGWEWLMRIAYKRGGREALKKTTSSVLPQLKGIPVFGEIYDVTETAAIGVTGEQTLEAVAIKAMDVYMGYNG